ncbi:MAG: ABC transporter permease [Peptococcaceae bacterium]|nr:ABC transporter permease [Peptococcaceae bacterium]
MKAVFVKEIRSFFTSMIGYTYIAFLILTIGLYFTAINLRGGYNEFGYVLANMNFVLIIAVPILTMRSLVEEKRQRTDQLLLTSPLSVSEIILGKFLALLAVFLIPLGVAATCPLLLSYYGAENLSTAYASLFGFFLLGGACIAIGLYFSSLTENQIIAAAATFFVLLMGYLMQDTIRLFTDSALTSFATFSCILLIGAGLYYFASRNKAISFGSFAFLEGLLLLCYLLTPELLAGLTKKLLNCFNLFEPFYRFIGGIFDLTSVLYYCSISFLFLFLTRQSIRKKSWG